MKFFLLLLTIAILAPAYVEPHSNHHHHNHKKHNNKHPVTCGAQTKTQELLKRSKTYRAKHELERKRADEYVLRMKQRKDHSFRKDVSKFTKKRKNNNNNNNDHDNINNNDNERRNLFSDYDDEIDKTPVIRIPVVYHVLYSTENGNLPDAQLKSQIRVLNRDYTGSNTEIENGEVASVFSDRVGNTKLIYYLNDTYRRAIPSDAICANETLFKKSEFYGLDAIDPKYYLNVWICNITSHGLLGYAYQPCLLDTNEEWMDGLVLGTDNVGSVEDDDGTFWFPEGTTYNLGRTGTHEIGHWLNLDHVWGTEDEPSCDDTDYVNDTPSSKEANYGCPPNTTNTCTEIDPELNKDLRDMYENFMDYSNDACMFMFTEEQVWRMRSVLSGRGCRREMYYAGAQLTGNETLMPSTIRTTTPSFECNNGCLISADYLNDGSCDCNECEDEDEYTCNSCGGCPYYCGDYIDCSQNNNGSGGGNNNNNSNDTILYVVLVLVLVLLIIIGIGVWYCIRQRNRGKNNNNNPGLAASDSANGNQYARMDGN